ncbi:hypothetical protein [Moorena sp. SIO3I8]|uniref:hypothetical protein n=1 Tax=Moorena sp. SIO3I8 TaxID=2607833 RepID=UPI0013BF9CC0|nr:hypothetical protein [Moorena sp. SIO3I8]NEO08427.1 hypothetical protein [Moorena sp. SIO3I8]
MAKRNFISEINRLDSNNKSRSFLPPDEMEKLLLLEQERKQAIESYDRIITQLEEVVLEDGSFYNFSEMREYYHTNGIGNFDFYITTKQEALQKSMYQEIERLQGLQEIDQVDSGRLDLYLGVALLIEDSDICREDSWRIGKDYVEKSGELLNESGGIDLMRSHIVFEFIPEAGSMHRIIDVLWHGIGEWKS